MGKRQEWCLKGLVVCRGGGGYVERDSKCYKCRDEAKIGNMEEVLVVGKEKVRWSGRELG